MTQTGYYAKAHVEDVHIQETYVSGQRISDPASLLTGAGSNIININMDPLPLTALDGFPLPRFPEQRIDVVNCSIDTAFQFLISAEGAGSPNAVPTQVHFTNVTLYSRQNKLIKSVETDTTFGGKLSVFMTECLFDLWDPGVTGRGQADVVDPWIALTVMRNCRSRAGRVSEIDTVMSLSVVASGPTAGQVQASVVNGAGYIDIPINLMWKPMTYSAAPISADAVTVGITSVGVSYPNTTGSTPDNTKPNLRIHVGQVVAGQVLSYNLKAAVAPPR
jgi:hypothetical protein